MKKSEIRVLLLNELIKEQNKALDIPANTYEQDQLIRSLFNTRPPLPASEKLIELQNAYLQGIISQKVMTDSHALQPIKSNICLWRGDITTLKVEAIVNAANEQMLGCFYPCHRCIDNAIHTFAGIQLRLECADMMKKQGTPERTGKAKITGAYNLPCKYILHTVGPIIQGNVTDHDRALLASCYRSCLALAEQYDIKSVAFCCIATGEFCFPNEEAAEIAVNAVSDYFKNSNCVKRVVFNVFTEQDEQIYKRLLG